MGLTATGPILGETTSYQFQQGGLSGQGSARPNGWAMLTVINGTELTIGAANKYLIDRARIEGGQDAPGTAASFSLSLITDFTIDGIKVNASSEAPITWSVALGPTSGNLSIATSGQAPISTITYTFQENGIVLYTIAGLGVSGSFSWLDTRLQAQISELSQ